MSSYVFSCCRVAELRQDARRTRAPVRCFSPFQDLSRQRSDNSPARMPGARRRFAVCHLLATFSHACAYVPVILLHRTTPLAPSRRPSQLALSGVTMEEPLPAAPVAAPELRLIATVGSKGSGLDQFEGPRHIAALPDGGVCVVDGLNQRVVLLDVEGCCTDSLEGLAAPTGVAVAGDLLYVAESTGAHRVSCRRLSDGKLLREVGGLGSGDGELHGPQCVVLSGASTPRHATPRHATPRRVAPRNATQRRAASRHATPRRATPRHGVSPAASPAAGRHRTPPHATGCASQESCFSSRSGATAASPSSSARAYASCGTSGPRWTRTATR